MNRTDLTVKQNPVVTIDLQEYNELLEARRKYTCGIKTITVNITTTEETDSDLNVFYIPAQRIVTRYVTETDDEAVSIIAEQLKELQFQLTNVNVRIESADKLKNDLHKQNIYRLTESHKAEIESIKKMSYFEFYRFKHNK